MHSAPIAPKWRASLAWLLPVIFVVAIVAALAAQIPARAAAPAALVNVKVQVPASMKSAPFDVDRYLNVPPNFAISVFARVANARFLAVAPNGDVLVSQPNSGEVKLLRPGSGDPQPFTFASGMSKPHDIVFHSYGGQSYVFIAAEDAIYRFGYTSGATQAGTRQTVVKNLPNGSSGELQGRYGHTLKNIAIDSNNKLYVSIASATNDDPSDLAANPKRGAIYTYDATKSDQEATSGALFAQGIRNAEGLAFVPGTNDLWVVVNNRDNIACPTDLNPIPGTTTNCAKGATNTAYIDNHPPEEFTRVVQNGNYGWPFCNPNPDTANKMDDMPFDRDVQNNGDGSKLDCNSANRINKGIQAHSAPLGVTFLGGTNAALPYRNGVLVGLHGSWNNSRGVGDKVIWFPWDSAKNAPGAEADFVTGWMNGASNYWGRPVDMAVAPDGSIYISDDGSGTIYKMTYSGANPTSTPTRTPGPTPVLTKRQWINPIRAPFPEGSPLSP